MSKEGHARILAEIEQLIVKKPIETTSNLATLIMTDRAVFATKVFTQASTPTGTPATRMPSVETPAPIAARSARAGSARTALSRGAPEPSC